MRTILCVGLLLFVARASFGEVFTSADTDEEEIAALIADLGHKHYSIRERATERLQSMVLAAKKQLEALVNSSDLEIRYRVRWLLSDIEEHVLRARLKAFKNGEPGATPPGWRQCYATWGDSPESRDLFGQMLRAHRKLLSTYDVDPAKAVELMSQICQEAKAENRGLSIASIAALLLVAGDEKIDLPAPVVTQLRVVLRGSGLAKLRSGADGKWLRPLLSRWIGRPCEVTNRAASNAKLMLAMEYGGQREVLKVAMDFSRQLQGAKAADPEWADQQAYFIHTIARLGDRTHIPLLEPLLEDQRSMPKGVQVRDVALICLVHLSGQHPQHYGFNFPFPEDDWNGIAWSRFQFRDPLARDAGFAKWRTWATENLKRDEKTVPPADPTPVE